MFLDTSGLLCLLHAAEHQHASALACFDADATKVTHAYVIAEFVALSQVRGLPRQETLAFIDDLENSPEIQLIYVGEALHKGALDLLRHRPDKSWSLCDAVSFLVMERNGESEALTTDHHFVQAGFVRLLAP
jgi:uncharacterized protein